MIEFLVHLYTSSLDNLTTGVPKGAINMISGRNERVLVLAKSESNAAIIALVAYPNMKISRMENSNLNLLTHMFVPEGHEGYIHWGETEMQFISVDTRSPKLTNLLTPIDPP